MKQKKTDPKYPHLVNLDEEGEKRFIEMVNRSYMSRTGIIRIALDCLYYTLDKKPVPKELMDLLKDLKKGVQI